MFLRIGGIHGVGKTTIISELDQTAHQLGLPITKVHGMDYLMRLAGVKTAEELRCLPEEIRASLRPQMYELMYSEDRANPNVLRIRDAHYSFIENGKVVECHPQPLDKGQMQALILMVADPEIIHTRRCLDCDRPDRCQNIDAIRRELVVEHEIAQKQAKELGIPLHVVDNTRQLLDSCLEIVHLIPPQYGKNELEIYYVGGGRERLGRLQ